MTYRGHLGLLEVFLEMSEISSALSLWSCILVAVFIDCSTVR